MKLWQQLMHSVLWPIRVAFRSFLIPELLLIERASQRQNALRLALDANQWRQVWARFKALLLFTPIVAVLYLTLASKVVDSLWFFAMGICWILAVGAWLGRKGVTNSVTAYLNTHGVRVCMACGYNLTGNVSGVCPECGTTVETAGGTPRSREFEL